MLKKKLIVLFLFVLMSTICHSQSQKKTLQTKFTPEKITVDAKLDEEAWKNAEIATNFVMVEPDNGTLESTERRTEVKIVYNNDAIYVGALLYDNPNTIKKELTIRDDFATADHFGITLNGFNDGQQDFRFIVSAAGVQQDCVYTEYNGEDFSWNAIWDSHVEITDFGWVVEMKIPYAALRFSSEEKQTWGLNFYREVRNLRQKFTWNRIDNNISNEANQAGILEGIENIKTPTRLFLIPYSSFYLNANDAQKTKGEFKGGLDVKYGINDAFTLDAILVPDFGQAAFDKVELNLGPFEQQFNENRPFFTEGTELFSKGFLLYSRRIGGRPSTQAELNSNEEFDENPSKVDLLNALKISGRTKDGLGVGILNAITEKTSAKIRNTVTGETRSEVIEPLTNYNVFVLDQRFRKNSSVSFLNTNVTRNGEFRDANVSAFLFDLNTKKNTYNLLGDYKYSSINEYKDLPNRKGYNTSLRFAETSGKYRYAIGGQYVSTNWDNNDLGINFQTHYHTLYFNHSYRILNPTKRFNSFNVNSNYYSEFDNRTGRLQGFNGNLNFNITSKKNDYYGFGFNGSPFETYDFYEPRTENEQRFLNVPKWINPWIFLSSNYNRKFAIDINPFATFFDGDNRYNAGYFISPRYRFTNKFSLIYEFSFNFLNNNLGYVNDDDNGIYIGKRDRTIYTNSISGKYTVNNVMNFNLSLRHYWSYAIYDSVFNLQEDGSLLLNPSYSTNHDENFNTWNLDLSYSWWFAPGSQISVLYRNNALIDDSGSIVDKDFGSNINNLVNNKNLDHIFSISIRYFIDYNSLKR
ncbi:MAG: hydrolase [Flavobacteriales bacterium]|nr:hydrolase [Flavobacteriales bacterium]